MTAFAAVIFDWSGTLVHDPPLRDRVAAAAARLGRPDSPETERICTVLRRHENDPDIAAAQRDADTGAAKYYAAETLHFRRAGLDGELAESLLHVDEDPAFRPLYPDTLPTLRRLKELGCRTAVLSDIHFDIRPLLKAQGAGDLIDDYMLSFEHGVQKPDRRIFELALERLELPPHRVLMVGDRSTHDGAAAECGMVTLLLPRLAAFGRRGLFQVQNLVRGQG
ncbi:HAD family hydrolase [Arthrobacter sp. ATA002]|uniref:HAD family hydrolase n=1 Tax=Arthrobacter sp. ATA002 TaxID=2991715 RepID=UPI0022A6CEB5|nr:HAD family hydrolase [Arthrobacter sp. ATA002]WAP52441.1 HAD family hydrolase [Arthrobacter sp. ATA002]